MVGRASVIIGVIALGLSASLAPSVAPIQDQSAAALALLMRQPDLEEFIAGVSDDFPDRLAGAWIEREPVPGVALYLVGMEPSEEIAARVAAASFRVEVTYGAQSTIAEKLAISEHPTIRQWANHSESVQGISISTSADALVFYVTEVVRVPDEVTSVMSDAGMSYFFEFTEPMSLRNSVVES